MIDVRIVFEKKDRQLFVSVLLSFLIYGYAILFSFKIVSEKNSFEDYLRHTLQDTLPSIERFLGSFYLRRGSFVYL